MSTSYQNFLKRLKWTDTSHLTFDMGQQEFKDRLQSHLDPYGPQDMFEAFSSSPNDYVGKIMGNELLMRRKRKIFDWTMGAVLVRGDLREKQGKVELDAVIEFPTWMPAMVLGFFILIYGMALVLVLAGVFEEVGLWMLPFFILHFIVLFSVFYFILRKGISSAKWHFERDIRYFLNSQTSEV